MTRRVLLCCDSIGDLYPVTKPSTIPHAFLTIQYTWHRRLGHPGSEVLCRLLSSNLISCTTEKPLILCHACQLGKHVRLPFVSSNTLVKSCFEVVHSDVYSLVNKSYILSKFVLFHNFVSTLFKREIKSFQRDHGGELYNNAFHKLFASNEPSNVISNIIRSSTIATNAHHPSSIITLVDTPQPTTPLGSAQHPNNNEPTHTKPTNADASQPHPTQNVNPNPVLVHPMITCFCVRSNRPTEHLNLHVSFISPLPKSYRDAFDDSNWQNAIMTNIMHLLKIKLGLLCPDLQTPILFILDGVDVDETFSLVVKPDTIQIALSLATSRHWHVHQLDVKNAFLHGMFLSQRKYVAKILERAHMVNYNPSRNRVDTELNLEMMVIRAEAEYRGVANVVAEICWLRNLLRELHTPLSSATLVYYDYVQVLHVPSRYQYAYIFTKALPSALFEEFRTSLSVRCLPAQTAGEC
uniref:Ribonuclease H-like domain-containing protein n=1 Tax=Tanacetum cinerariifolium TaxID=118510 RepID=A0A6L2NFT8_TANCI|nr:ribonuclease H-like domain-containing protein [Tanacetum cinerariifolium]